MSRAVGPFSDSDEQVVVLPRTSKGFGLTLCGGLGSGEVRHLDGYGCSQDCSLHQS